MAGLPEGNICTQRHEAARMERLSQSESGEKPHSGHAQKPKALGKKMIHQKFTLTQEKRK
jgi:hypothetical protein